MTPYQQGKLDSLCGLYSIINSSRLIHQYDNQYCQLLFSEIISYLALESSLFKITTAGINFSTIGRIITDVSNLNLIKEKPFKGVRTIPLELFWSSMASFLAEPNRAILLGLGGLYDHWTVVQKITDKRIVLFDSSQLKYLNKSSCTTQIIDGTYPHIIKPRYTLYLKSKSELLSS